MERVHYGNYVFFGIFFGIDSIDNTTVNLLVRSYHLTVIYFKDLHAAFHMFDKNGDSKISEKELFEVMKYLGLDTTLEEAKAMIKVADKNRKSL